MPRELTSKDFQMLQRFAAHLDTRAPDECLAARREYFNLMEDWQREMEIREGRSKITEEERKEFPSHTDESILGIRAIRSIEDADLQTLLGSETDIETLRLNLGEKTNPAWVLGQVAEECYIRGLIDHVRFDEVTR